MPSPRDLAAEVAHLRAWWATRREDLPPLGRLAKRAGLNPTTARRLSTDPSLRVGPAFLDAFYPTLAALGYEPLSNDYLFL